MILLAKGFLLGFSIAVGVGPIALLCIRKTLIYGKLSGFGLMNGTTNYASIANFVLGVFLGSGIWWLALSLGIGFFREKITTEWLLMLNKISGIIIFGFGLFALLGLAK